MSASESFPSRVLWPRNEYLTWNSTSGVLDCVVAGDSGSRRSSSSAAVNEILMAANDDRQ